MLSKLLQTSNLFHLLFFIDSELVAVKRLAGCPHCGGPLHQSNYIRQPRGGPVGLPEEYCLRRSLRVALGSGLTFKHYLQHRM
jgi:hypothetical protein